MDVFVHTNLEFYVESVHSACLSFAIFCKQSNVSQIVSKCVENGFINGDKRSNHGILGLVAVACIRAHCLWKERMQTRIQIHMIKYMCRPSFYLGN